MAEVEPAMADPPTKGDPEAGPLGVMKRTMMKTRKNSMTLILSPSLDDVEHYTPLKVIL